jgi:hypothetical protein
MRLILFFRLVRYFIIHGDAMADPYPWGIVGL